MGKGKERINAKILAEKYDVPAKDKKYAKGGIFFMTLDQFPVCLFDPEGLVYFQSKAELDAAIKSGLLNPTFSKMDKKWRLNAPGGGIRFIPGYTRFEDLPIKLGKPSFARLLELGENKTTGKIDSVNKVLLAR